MISYLTEIDLKKRDVRIIFRGETNTFAFDEAHNFSLLDAIKVSAEFAHNQVIDFLAQAAEYATRKNNIGNGRLRSDKYPLINEYLDSHGPSRVKHMADALGLNTGNLCMLLKSGERHGIYSQNEDKTWQKV